MLGPGGGPREPGYAQTNPQPLPRTFLYVPLLRLFSFLLKCYSALERRRSILSFLITTKPESRLLHVWAYYKNRHVRRIPEEDSRNTLFMERLGRSCSKELSPKLYLDYSETNCSSKRLVECPIGALHEAQPYLSSREFRGYFCPCSCSRQTLLCTPMRDWTDVRR